MDKTLNGLSMNSAGCKHEISKEGQKPEELVITSRPIVGLFAVFNQVVGHLHFCEQKGLRATVFLSSNWPYHQKGGYLGALNGWEYFFGAIGSLPRLLDQPESHLEYCNIYDFDNEHITVGEFSGHHYDLSRRGHITVPPGVTITSLWPAFHGGTNRLIEENRVALYKIIEKYIFVREEIRLRVDRFWNEHLAGYFVIGVHMRGGEHNDEIQGWHGLAFADEQIYFREIDQLLASNPEAKVFLATDTQSACDTFKKQYGDRLISFDSRRSTDGQAPHTEFGGAEIGAEMLIEGLLMSRCNVLVHGISNVAFAVLCMSPTMPHVNVYQVNEASLKAKFQSNCRAETDETVLPEFSEDLESLKIYNKHILENRSFTDVTPILCIASLDYLFDFLIFYFSVVDSWRFFPFEVHLFTLEKRTCDIIKELALPHVVTHHFQPPDSLKASWGSNAALKVQLIEHSGLDKGLVSDIDALMLAETPEMLLLLQSHDFVFIGSPSEKHIIQTSFWSFKRSSKSIKFARKWHHESKGRIHSDASGLPFALSESPDLSYIVLATEKPVTNVTHCPCPYDVQVNMRPLNLSIDELGVYEAEMGRAKVLHFGGLRSSGHESVESRFRVMADLFPESADIFPKYFSYASKAATLLGMETCKDLPGLIKATSDCKTLPDESLLKRYLLDQTRGRSEDLSPELERLALLEREQGTLGNKIGRALTSARTRLAHPSSFQGRIVTRLNKVIKNLFSI